MTENWKHEHISASRLSLGQRCALAFRKRYIEGHKGQATQPLLIGSLVHEAIEAVTGIVLKLPAGEVLEGAPTLQALGVSAEGIDAAGYELAEELLENWYTRTDLTHCVAAEKEFRLQVGKWELLGYMDRVDFLPNSHVSIVDYKSGWLIPSREEVEHALQAVFYAAAGRGLWPWAKKVTVRFEYLRHRTAIEVEPSKDRCQRYMDWAEVLALQLEQGPWPGSPGETCSWCDHRWDCEALTSDTLSMTMETLAAQRELAAAQAKVSKKRKEDLDKLLKEALEEKGEPIRFNGTSYQLHTAEYKSYDLKQLLSALSLMADVPERDIAREVCKLDLKAARAWAKTNGVLDVLETIGTRRKSSRLWARKMEGPE